MPSDTNTQTHTQKHADTDTSDIRQVNARGRDFGPPDSDSFMLQKADTSPYLLALYNCSQRGKKVTEFRRKDTEIEGN